MPEIEAKMATCVVSASPDVLYVQGVGSCLIVTAYDRGKKIGGMLHAMLPTLTGGDMIKEKYVDSGIDALYAKMREKGSLCVSLDIKMVGAANMFPGLEMSNKVNIGERNVEVAVAKFEKMKIKVSGTDVGGTHGRSVYFNLANGVVDVRTRM